MKTNFHTHTVLCRHASGTAGEYASFARNFGLDALGFSDHAPFPGLNLGYRMDYCELDGYINDVRAAKKLFDGKMKIYTGLEIEYLTGFEDYYKQLLDKDGFAMDYLALGEHFFGRDLTDNKNITQVTSTAEYREYADSVAEAMATGYFAFCAHPDIFLRNEFEWDENCDYATKRIITAAEKYDIPLEVNANGLRRGLQKYPDGIRYPYPDKRFWQELSGSDIKVIVGADAHIPEQVWDRYLDLAYDMCDELKLNVIDSLF